MSVHWLCADEVILHCSQDYEVAGQVVIALDNVTTVTPYSWTDENDNKQYNLKVLTIHLTNGDEIYIEGTCKRWMEMIK